MTVFFLAWAWALVYSFCKLPRICTFPLPLRWVSPALPLPPTFLIIPILIHPISLEVTTSSILFLPPPGQLI